MTGYNYVLGDVLAVGSAPPEGIRLRPAFDTLILCAKEYQPSDAWFPDMRVLRVALDDSGPPPTEAEVQAAITAGHEVARQLRCGKKLLITCYMGRNRSALVAGIALLELGLSARAAIVNIKQARGRRALSNEHFVALLKKYGRSSYDTPHTHISR